ncbi:MAG: hypothetical protein AMK72_02005 [Planctomycetes bacterium SM23_25]|nr:MAG: hypothetical protein AMK72_02005 [Planctomycetes bacterium SM23_25]
MWHDHRGRLILLAAVAVVLVGVYVAVHGVPGFGRSGGPEVRPTRTGGDPRAADPAGDGSAGPAYGTLVKLAQRRDPENLPRFRQQAASPDWQTRHAAITGIGRLGKGGDPVLLVTTLRNPEEHPEVRAAAAGALGQMRCWDAGAALIEALRDPSRQVRAAAGGALRRIMRVDCRFRANDPLPAREAAIRRIQQTWSDFYQGHLNTISEQGRDE